jgi:uncharacterized paraquat-inducible protein A
MAKKKEKTAQWIRIGIGDEERFQCSACDMVWFLAYGTPIQNEMFYCPRCGAKMTDGSVK